MADADIEFFAGDVPVGELPGNLSWMADPGVRRVMEVLGQARFVGGAVRDGLLGRETKDIDIATPLHPDTAMRLLSPEFNVKPVGIQHGSIAAYLPGGFAAEITTLRQDVRTDGRRAEIEFTESWYADSGRRDFTINALYADSAGRVYDYQGGMDDLGRGIVRFIGRPEERIAEDHLRILRSSGSRRSTGAGGRTCPASWRAARWLRACASFRASASSGR